MSYAAVPNEVLKNPAISPQAKALYAVLCSYAWGDSNECFASQGKLASDMGYSDTKTIRTLVSELERERAIEVGRKGKLNRYLILHRGSTPGEHRGSTPGDKRRKTHEKKTQDQEPSSAAPPSEKRNTVWDALAEVYPPPTTRSEASDFGKTVSEIRAALLADGVPEEAWRDEIRRRALSVAPEYRSHRSLRNRWGELGQKATTEEGEPPRMPDVDLGPCLYCDGSGSIDGERCEECGGTGEGTF